MSNQPSRGSVSSRGRGARGRGGRPIRGGRGGAQRGDPAPSTTSSFTTGVAPQTIAGPSTLSVNRAQRGACGGGRGGRQPSGGRGGAREQSRQTGHLAIVAGHSKSISTQLTTVSTPVAYPLPTARTLSSNNPTRIPAPTYVSNPASTRAYVPPAASRAAQASTSQASTVPAPRKHRYHVYTWDQAFGPEADTVRSLESSRASTQSDSEWYDGECVRLDYRSRSGTEVLLVTPARGGRPVRCYEIVKREGDAPAYYTRVSVDAKDRVPATATAIAAIRSALEALTEMYPGELKNRRTWAGIKCDKPNTDNPTITSFVPLPASQRKNCHAIYDKTR